jgi:preprotein translocase subunit YajC
MNKYNVGDKFIIEISKNDTNELDTTEYYITNGSRVYEKEELDRLQKYKEEQIPYSEAYNKGLNDVWELAKKLWCPTNYGGMDIEEVIKIFDCDYFAISKLYTPQEALAKLEAYEKSKEIKAGDVVESINTGRIGVITKVEENGKYVIFADGTSGMFAHDDIRKTGRYIDITSVLEQLRGD